MPNINWSCIINSLSIKDLNKAAISEEIHQACRTHGYFLIKDFDMEESDLAGVFSEASEFFRLPVEEKSKNKSLPTNQYLGYRGIGTEKSVMTGYPELCEQYKVGYFHDKKSNSSTLHLNYLSSYESVFRKYVRSCFNHMEKIATSILMTIADNFNLGRDYFLPYCNQPTHQLGLNYYPTRGTDEISNHDYAMSAHKDLCLLTIIAQNKSGIMVQDLRGEWKLIPYVPNTLIVMLGDYLERWTNNYYVAPIHRVLESSDDARISIIFKHRPNYETVIPVIRGINQEKDYHDIGGEFHTGKAYEEKINRIMS